MNGGRATNVTVIYTIIIPTKHKKKKMEGRLNKIK